MWRRTKYKNIFEYAHIWPHTAWFQGREAAKKGHFLVARGHYFSDFLEIPPPPFLVAEPLKKTFFAASRRKHYIHKWKSNRSYIDIDL